MFELNKREMLTVLGALNLINSPEQRALVQRIEASIAEEHPDGCGCDKCYMSGRTGDHHVACSSAPPNSCFDDTTLVPPDDVRDRLSVDDLQELSPLVVWPLDVPHNSLVEFEEHELKFSGSGMTLVRVGALDGHYIDNVCTVRRQIGLLTIKADDGEYEMQVAHYPYEWANAFPPNVWVEILNEVRF